MKQVKDFFKQFLSEQRTKIDRAKKAGVTIVFGSDEWCERKSGTRGETALALLAAMTQFGLTPIETIRAATTHAAKLLEAENTSGSIAPKLATRSVPPWGRVISSISLRTSA